ncbi:MAG TPA: FAD-dependent monooxygenase [Actinomycetes bacterium]|jgi:FAD-dependent urate hydroxylase|nr:FAD-dependent monooxygenase [Actinomycetes bacterium]
MRKVLIAGGGIAGPVTAMALQRAGIDAEVFEAHRPGTGDAGSYLTVATNGLDALRAVDADKPVLAAGFPTPTNLLLSSTGRRLGAASNGGRLADGTVSHTIKRARLYQALHEEAAARDIGVQYGKRLVGAEPAAGGGVVAAFEDGTRATGDLLVGADGVHSPTRRLLDRAAPSPRYVGLVNFGGYTPGGGGAPGVWHMIFGRRAFFGHVADPDGGTVWFANVPRPAVTPAERAATTAEQWQRQLIDLFAGDAGPARDLIAAGHLELAGDSTHDLPSVPVWHRGPMVIVGDAAHAPSPTSGQGASMAAEDAVVLAKCLRDLADIPQALAAYEGLRRQRVERIVAQGARTGSAKTPGPVGRALRDLALPLIFKLLVSDRSMAWIYNHHIDWDTPVPAPAQPA